MLSIKDKSCGYLTQQLFELVMCDIQKKQVLKIILNQMFVVQHWFDLWTFSPSGVSLSCRNMRMLSVKEESCGYLIQQQLFEPASTNIQ